MSRNRSTSQRPSTRFYGRELSRQKTLGKSHAYALKQAALYAARVMADKKAVRHELDA